MLRSSPYPMGQDQALPPTPPLPEGHRQSARILMAHWLMNDGTRIHHYFIQLSSTGLVSFMGASRFWSPWHGQWRCKGNTIFFWFQWNGEGRHHMAAVTRDAWQNDVRSGMMFGGWDYRERSIQLIDSAVYMAPSPSTLNEDPNELKAFFLGRRHPSLITDQDLDDE